MRALLFSIVGAQLICHAPRTGLNIFEMSKVKIFIINCNDSDGKALSTSPISLDIMVDMVDMMQALSTSPISLDEPWLIDLSHLLLVISASCNVVIYTAQVGRKQKTAQVGRQKLKSRH